ncbi:MAG: glycosyltransferase [Steroidobacteraceae bacterium]|nr:glycosyltransferase [Deltaproteobacteria bacterium]
MTTYPTVSVVIPLYNHERYIDATLDSVLAQTVPPTEIIVVDDGSQDNSSQRVAARAAQDPRIITWSHPNQGAHYTINTALLRSSSKYIAILNSDDCYYPQRIEACLQALERDPGADAVCSALTFLDDNGKPCRNKWYEESLAFYRQTNDLSLALINGNFLMTTSNLFIRRSVFNEVGYFANLRYAHDLDFFLRLIVHGRKITLLEQPLLHYRTHATNTISEGVLKVKLEWAAVVAFFAWQVGTERGWEYLDRLTEVTDRHNLTRLIFFFFKQFQQTPLSHITVDSWLSNDDFVKFMAGAVQ